MVSATSTQNTTEFYDTYHSIQTSFNRRFRNGFSFGANYTLGLSSRATPACRSGCSTRRTARSRIRADQAEYEELNKNLDLRPHFFKANAVWDLPDRRATSGAGKRSSG